MRITTPHTVSALLLAFAFFGCAAETDAPPTEGSQSLALTGDASDVAQVEAALVSGFEPGDAPVPGEALQELIDRIKAEFDECVDVVEAPPHVTFTFDNCNGDGLVNVNGDVTVTVMPAWRSKTYAVVTDNLDVSGISIALDAEATVAREGENQKRYVVTSTSDLIGPRGHAMTSTADFEVFTTGDCRSIDGTWRSEGLRGSQMTIAGLTVCDGSCPASGVVTAGNVTLTFDGDDTASWSFGERSGQLPLFCE